MFMINNMSSWGTGKIGTHRRSTLRIVHLLWRVPSQTYMYSITMVIISTQHEGLQWGWNSVKDSQNRIQISLRDYNRGKTRFLITNKFEEIEHFNKGPGKAEPPLFYCFSHKMSRKY